MRDGFACEFHFPSPLSSFFSIDMRNSQNNDKTFVDKAVDLAVAQFNCRFKWNKFAISLVEVKCFYCGKNCYVYCFKSEALSLSCFQRAVDVNIRYIWNKIRINVLNSCMEYVYEMVIVKNLVVNHMKMQEMQPDAFI